MKVYYWSPHLSKVATVKSVLNSCKSLNKKKGFEAKIINVIGEWDHINKKYRIDLLSTIKFYKFIPKEGYLSSRFASLLIFIFSFIPLYLFLKKTKPNFLIIHLLTSIPMMVNNFFKLKTKIILRISGLPRLNIFRKFFWKLSKKKISFVTSPTLETKQKLIKLKLFDEKKLFLLRDPIIDKKKNKSFNLRNYKKREKFLAIGRLTKQKNFSFLIECFEKILIKYENISLTIAGEGEQKNHLSKMIKNRKLENRIKLIGYRKNINELYLNHDCFILTSLWEDPGFVLIEAAFHSIPIITSDCRSGPKEISMNGKNMFMFKTNSEKDFLKKFDTFMKIKNFELKKKCKRSRQIVKKFSIHAHSNSLVNLLNQH